MELTKTDMVYIKENMPEKDKAYVAGILDSGGTVMVSRGRPLMRIMRREKEVLEMVKKLYGGCLTKSGSGWVYTLTGKVVSFMLWVVLPYMHGSRKEQLREIRDFYKNKSNGGGEENNNA